MIKTTFIACVLGLGLSTMAVAADDDLEKAYELCVRHGKTNAFKGFVYDPGYEQCADIISAIDAGKGRAAAEAKRQEAAPDTEFLRSTLGNLHK
ncbi:MAG: hypothetical protein WDN46_03415 [Methylocella sp.]